jgi:hypothetical protein
MLRSIVVCLVSLVALGCNDKKDESPAAAPGGSAAAVEPKNKSAAIAPESKGPLVKAKISKDECIFEFSAPEELKQTDSDGVSVTYKSGSFTFTGFAGSDLKSPDTFIPYVKMLGAGEDPIASGREDGVQWAVTLSKTPAEPFYGAYGSGGEEYGRRKSSSSLGCSFACTGTKERQGDVIAMCKSVKISVDESKIPK